MDAKKIANNILEFMFDPTVIPVEKRLYFRPEEKLDNKAYMDAKTDSYKAYGDERHNSDFYPIRNKSKEASIMDRKTIIASLDVLSQSFSENDPIGKDLRTMAYAMSKMSDEEIGTRLASSQVEAKKKVKLITCPSCGNKKVMAQTGYCLKCGEKGIGKDKAKGEKEEKKAKKSKKASDWSKAASLAVARALVADVCATSVADDAEEATATKEPESKTTPAPEKKPEVEEKKEYVEAAKEPESKTTPEPEKKPEVEEKKEPVEATEEPESKTTPEPEKKPVDANIVDTSVLAYEGLEMGESSIDSVVLTAEDTAQLDMLFKK